MTAQVRHNRCGTLFHPGTVDWPALSVILHRIENDNVWTSKVEERRHYKYLVQPVVRIASEVARVWRFVSVCVVCFGFNSNSNNLKGTMKFVTKEQIKSYETIPSKKKRKKTANCYPL